MQINNPIPQPLQDCLLYRSKPDDIVKYMDNDLISEKLEAGTADNVIGTGLSSGFYRVPFCKLTHQFDALENIFIGMG
jgi:hypothetical protein